MPIFKKKYGNLLTINFVFSSLAQVLTHLHTLSRNSRVKKWLQMFPALKVKVPSSLRSSAVSMLISLYSTTWQRLLQRQTTPTRSVGCIFCTTCIIIGRAGIYIEGVGDFPPLRQISPIYYTQNFCSVNYHREMYYHKVIFL